MQTAVETEGIQFHRIPPLSPNSGDLWEVAMKSVKGHLVRVVGEQLLAYEEFHTVLTQIKAILNSRPLGLISSDPNDVSELNPVNFLTLAPLSFLPDEDLTDIKMGRLGRWQIVQKIQQSFWLKWHRKYLYILLQRSKWTDPSVPISTGDLILLKDDLSPPLKWHLARVVEEHGGIDGIARVVTVKTAEGTLKRPVTKVINYHDSFLHFGLGIWGAVVGIIRNRKVHSGYWLELYGIFNKRCIPSSDCALLNIDYCSRSHSRERGKNASYGCGEASQISDCKNHCSLICKDGTRQELLETVDVLNEADEKFVPNVAVYNIVDEMCCNIRPAADIIQKKTSGSGSSTSTGLEDLECERLFLQNYSGYLTGRLTVTLPFKHPSMWLENSQEIALSRLLPLENKFNEVSGLRLSYNEVMKDFLDQGHMRSVPRYLGAGTGNPVMVLAFGDASQEGYGAVLFLRSTTSIGYVTVNLVCARYNLVFSPRLELCATVLVSKLVKQVTSAYRDRVVLPKIHAFSYSTTVIQWLSSGEFKEIFVANRVHHIREQLPTALWCHVSLVQLLNHPCWLSGPS
ncbi:hypothetical protein JTB14_025288 [Gonioctena quinquepunctata]|nr:hypothetical protein JTB14_025288 [Gonioctena quinquepunctata]